MGANLVIPQRWFSSILPQLVDVVTRLDCHLHRHNSGGLCLPFVGRCMDEQIT